MKMLPILDINEALYKGDFNLLRTLVVSGSDVNLQDKEGKTALINCCLHDGETWAFGSARLLLTHGARLSLCDKFGRNALMYAVLYKRESLVKLFLNALDCDLTHTDKWKHTALSYAVLTGNIKILTMLNEILKKYGLDREDTLVTKDNSVGHPGLKKSPQHFKAKVDRIHYKLPYKSIPALIWEKRAKFYNVVKSKITRDANYRSTLQATSKSDCNDIAKEKPSSANEESIISKTDPDKTQDTCWRQDLQKIAAVLEMQLSSSYCRKARLLPPGIHRYPKISKSEMDRYSADELRGKRRNKDRRLSVDVLDALQRQKSTKGIFRRRCSVAVIPLIRFQSYKLPLSNKKETEDQKS